MGRCGNRASAGSHGVDLHLCALRLAVHCNLETSRCGNGRLASKATSTIDLGAGNCTKLHQFIAVHSTKVHQDTSRWEGNPARSHHGHGNLVCHRHSKGWAIYGLIEQGARGFLGGLVGWMGVMSLIEAWDLGISEQTRQMPSARHDELGNCGRHSCW